MKRFAFTMIELIFVIVIMGIIGKFGVEFLANAYKSFIYTNINHNLQSDSQTAVKLIASRLQYRIKDSIIARNSAGNQAAFVALGNAAGNAFDVLQWIGSDIDGFRGFNSTPSWSGINDIQAGNNALINSPGTDTGAVNSVIIAISTSTINDAALYFIGSNSDIMLDYGWSGNTAYIRDQNGSIHPINSVALQPTHFIPALAGATFTDVYEYYKLAWTAYAVALEPNLVTGRNDLFLYDDYQPWNGEVYNHAAGRRILLMENVDTFQFMAIGSLVKIQVCVSSDIIDGDATGGYSICKEKTIY